MYMYTKRNTTIKVHPQNKERSQGRKKEASPDKTTLLDKEEKTKRYMQRPAAAVVVPRRTVLCRRVP
jgi:hypothetical protein